MVMHNRAAPGKKAVVNLLRVECPQVAVAEVRQARTLLTLPVKHWPCYLRAVSAQHALQGFIATGAVFLLRHCRIRFSGFTLVQGIRQ